ncbi:hypothetical protein [Mycoplasmopsis iners]|uniref:hypothetical protein n=1 Tax=Mycoplasmopsis iners TaxID=76630 RepID=UPI0004971D0E|nr:hypothetical protein [Mycoplasmopsis iners]
MEQTNKTSSFKKFFSTVYGSEYIKNAKDPKELWNKYEKPYFRYGIFGTLASFIVVFAIFLTKFVLTIVNKQELIREISSSYAGQKSGEEITSLYNGSLAWSGVILVISMLLLFWISYGIIMSYKSKTFLKISRVPLMLFFVYLFSTIINFILSITNYGDLWKSATDYPAKITLTIIEIVSMLVFLILYIVFVRLVSRIQAAFVRATQYQQMLKLQEDLAKSGIQNEFLANLFGAPIDKEKNINEETTSSTYTEEDVKETVAKSQREQNKEKLMEQPNSKLFEIAEKLYIRGYQSMTREELVETILNSLNNTNNTNNN